MLYDIVTPKELQDITSDDVLKEANTECILRNKVQAVAQGLVEGKEGYGIDKVVGLLERLSRDRRDGVIVEDGEDNKRVRAKYGTSDYVYYTVFMGMLQNHPLISRRLEEFRAIRQGQGQGNGNTVKMVKDKRIVMVRDFEGNVMVFNGCQLAGTIMAGEDSIKWYNMASTKHLPTVARLLKALESQEPVQDIEAGQDTEIDKEVSPW